MVSGQYPSYVGGADLGEKEPIFKPVLRIQTLLIQIRILLFTLIRIRIPVFNLIWIRIRLFDIDLDLCRFQEVMYLKQYFLHPKSIFLVSRSKLDRPTGLNQKAYFVNNFCCAH